MRVSSVSVIASTVAAVGLFIGAGTVLAEEINGAATATMLADRRGNATQTKPPPPPPQPESATYRVTIVLDWTSSTHPLTVPPNAHISPTVVATHGQIGDLFVRGALASNGIEQMAETGGTSILRSELAGDPTVTGVQTGSRIDDAGQQSFTVTLTQGAPMVSLVTMLAPSPDWFVGIRDRSMFVDGEWVQVITTDLANYDAGTDSGSTWTSSNFDTNPAQVISGPRDAAFIAGAAEEPFARVIIERL
ncbi:MAG: spondin domain-containing protein [Ilumatobacter sp.]